LAPRRVLAATATVLLVPAAWQLSMPSVTPAHAATRPDVIVIITDDQRWDTMQDMPLTSAWLPTNYPQAVVSNPACCPSRTSILTSTYSQDNGVWTNSPPYGGWPAFVANGWPGHTIADALQGAGYRTALFGKFLNSWDGTIPPGWDRFAAHFHADAFPGMRLAPYYDYTLRTADQGVVTDVNHGEAPADYSTSVIDAMATDYIRTTPADQPLFLYYAPAAPHSAGSGTPPIPAPQDLDATVTLLPASPNVNEADVSDKPSYIAGRSELMRLPRWRVAQARSLLSVDRSIDDIMRTIAETRDLSNTLVLFLGDNGFADGSHRWLSKGVPYEEALRVPMRARLDGVLPPGDDPRLADNLDIAPTIAEAAGIAFPSSGGTSLLQPATRDHLVIEGGTGTHRFCGVRTLDEKYVKYATGEEEYYDLRTDPFETMNDPSAAAVEPLRQLAVAECWPLPPLWPRDTL